ncbi:MAG TPA: hypothetical protein PKD53_16695 [Chloroflexaceae bacterium]|nr:hypothetical protein [Chloroflexaceae bacterium]
MPTLPITRIILFKHGVGYFERRGAHSGERLELSFPREAMDDVLKSLVAADLGAGQVLGVDFETPEDRAARLARGSVHLSDSRSLLDLLRDLRGRPVRLSLGDGKKAEPPVEGLVVGVDYEPDEPLRRAIVSVYAPEARQVRAVPVEDVARLELLDEGAAADLAYFLRAAQSEEQRRAAALRLTPGDHELLVGYIAPAPAWRVSYRLLFEEDQRPKTIDEGRAGTAIGLEGQQPASGQDGAPLVVGPSSFVLLQGWGLFDNQLEEDLADVRLTLMAGMPVSFRYGLYEPRTPERPLVRDEERTVDAPIFFDAAAQAPPAPAAAPMLAGAMLAEAADAGYGGARKRAAVTERLSAAQLEEAVQVAAGGDERGALFAYSVEHPVSVARGQSAMVPILSRRLPARRELLYNGAKHPRHPVASLRLTNETGLTLERGPVTVLDGGDYAGEAVLPFTRAGAELIVPFAVELGIAVSEERQGARRLVGVSFKGDYAVFEEHDLLTTTYQLSSGLDRTAEVMVEHGRLAGYEVAAPRAPDEESAGFARWRVPCPPHARVSFAVTERRLTSRHEQVRALSGAQLQAFMRDRLLDQETLKALAAILALYRQADEAQARIHRLEAEREAIYKQQRQIQGSLQPLGREGDEGALRQRYVATLGQLEDRLAALAAEAERLRQAIAALEEQAARRIRGLGQQ